MMLTMIMSTITYSVFYVKDKKTRSILFICIILSVIYDMVLATRTLLIISIIVFGVTYSIHMVWNKKNIKKYLCLLGLILAIVIVVSFIYNINLLGMKEMLTNKSNLFARLEDSETTSSDSSRVKAQIEAIKQLPEFPFGGNFDKIAGLNYAHNMWLDVARQAGIIPFTLLLMFFLFNIKSLVEILKDQNTNRKFKMLLIGLYCAVFLNFLVEPVLQGAATTFSYFVIIMGIINQKACMIKEKNTE